jgi:hypothetical protein
MAGGELNDAGNEQGLVHHLPSYWTHWVRRHRLSCFVSSLFRQYFKAT